MDVKHIPIYIESCDLPHDAWKVIKIIREDWIKEDIRFKIFTDGITNKLIGCFCISEPNQIVLVRVNGEKTNLYIDRAMEVENFKLMQSKGHAPTLFATFDNGMVYEFIHGEILNLNSCQDETIYPLVASTVAKVHKLRYAGNVPLIANVWEKCERFINLIPDQFSTTEKQSRFIQHFPSGKSGLLNCFGELKNVLQNSDNPVVFCHNDLLLANVIYTGKSVSFIDYEYAGYNHQAFDIANHFNEFTGVTEFNSSLYPSDEFQLKWIKVYLLEYYGTDVSATDEKVKLLHGHVRQFTPVSHFFWAVWSLMQAHHSSTDFNYMEYAVLKYNEYKKSLKNIYS